jgi:hypothetical protein
MTAGVPDTKLTRGFRAPEPGVQHTTCSCVLQSAREEASATMQGGRVQASSRNMERVGCNTA